MVDQIIEKVAKQIGIETYQTDSKDGLNTQLRNHVKKGDHPILMISWDKKKRYSWNDNGLAQSPYYDIVGLLVSKPEILTKDEHITVANEMEVLFDKFIRALYKELTPYQTDRSKQPIVGAQSTLAPMYGLGKHSGCLCVWSMIDKPSNYCE